jgi:hypothetical protein
LKISETSKLLKTHRHAMEEDLPRAFSFKKYEINGGELRMMTDGG